MMVDHWEVSMDDLRLERVLGEGAFGKVYKGMITNLPQQLSVPKRKMSVVSAITPFGSEEGYVVAVKMLQGEIYCKNILTNFINNKCSYKFHR